MKGKTLPAIVRLEDNVLQQLTTEVIETIAAKNEENNNTSNNNFGVVDLWNRQRQMRSASGLISVRRWKMNLS
jgi:hypothetical protein